MVNTESEYSRHILKVDSAQWSIERTREEEEEEKGEGRRKEERPN
jgi:hypothetical protein